MKIFNFLSTLFGNKDFISREIFTLGTLFRLDENQKTLNSVTYRLVYTPYIPNDSPCLLVIF